MDDVFDVLDCCLRSRYVTLEAMPTLPIWERLPGELRGALADALASGKRLGDIAPLVRQVRAELRGQRAPDTTGERTRATVALQLGLLYLAYREGRLDPAKLLTRAFHVADSYDCEVDPRPFQLLRAELAVGRPEKGRLETLFAPYAGAADLCVERWGLSCG